MVDGELSATAAPESRDATAPSRDGRVGARRVGGRSDRRDRRCTTRRRARRISEGLGPERRSRLGSTIDPRQEPDADSGEDGSTNERKVVDADRALHGDALLSFRTVEQKLELSVPRPEHHVVVLREMGDFARRSDSLDVRGRREQGGLGDPDSASDERRVIETTCTEREIESFFDDPSASAVRPLPKRNMRSKARKRFDLISLAVH